ncbi:MFS transporter [Kitasatospora viridis]|uniref:Putative MFS family arabinose efflux permease n=1 Tax=Kitasatospora viridis TaxID=281105 RepID=A0A561SEY2_9ACTN|nr:MFS transporter [Kitasatospora viridis]TWF73421.1 putative MFS family arabinose efflux permease [Kitasatospora viridis]
MGAMVAGAKGAEGAGSAGRRQLGVFLTAKTVSDIGYALDFICLSVFVWERTRSGVATGLVSVALYAGAIGGGRLGQRFGDRWDRRRVMIGADLVRAVMLGLLAVLPAAVQRWWLYPAVVLVGAGRSVFEATMGAATPVLAGSRTQAVNSALAGLKGVAFMVGMGLAAVLAPAIGYRGVFGLDAGSYLLSATVLLALRLRMRESGERGGARRETAGAWPLLVGAGLAGLVVLRVLDAFGSSSQQVGLPMLGTQLHPSQPAVVSGVVWGSWAAGLLLGSFVLRPLAKRLVERAPALVYCLATMAMSVGFIGVFWLGGWWPRLVAAGLAGLGDALSEITYKQSLQRLPDERRGRAFGLSQVSVNAGFMAGLLATSLVLQPSRLAPWVLLLHGVPLLVAGWMAVGAARSQRLPARLPNAADLPSAADPADTADPAKGAVR